MVAKLVSGVRPGEFIISEAPGAKSRDNLMMKMTATLVERGTVCGKITASGLVVPLAPGASDGSEVASVLNIYRVDASAGNTMFAALTSDAEIISDDLIWPAGISAPQQTAALAQLNAIGFKVRPPSYVG